MVLFIETFAITLVVAGAAVAGVLHLVKKQQDKARSEMIDREYARLCDDPRYRSNNL